MAGALYIVATPIGNLEDISFRAVRVLQEVNLIAAEDTRHTQVLLNHYAIRTPLTSYHEHNERAKALQLVERLRRGEDIALVSDAGTPAISDPGYRLIVEAVRAGFRVVPIPGASALTAVLSACGLATDRFVFEGFVPEKKHARRETLRRLRPESRTLVFYEAPHRLMDSVHDMREILGDRAVVVAREITKVHEEFLRGRLTEVAGQLAAREIKGEVVIVVAGSQGESEISEAQVKDEIRKLKNQGLGVKAIAELIGERHSLAKREVYRMALEMGDADDPGC